MNTLRPLRMARSVIRDEFNGNNRSLRESIKALIELNDENALFPHGIGGHARALLAACYRRLPNDKPSGVGDKH